MKPSKLQDHLRRCHPDKTEKDLEYFQTLKDKFQKRPTLDRMFASTSQRNDDGLRASYNISLLIAKSGKPHTIGEKKCAKQINFLFPSQERQDHNSHDDKQYMKVSDFGFYRPLKYSMGSSARIPRTTGAMMKRFSCSFILILAAKFTAGLTKTGNKNAYLPIIVTLNRIEFEARQQGSRALTSLNQRLVYNLSIQLNLPLFYSLQT
ncbi:unnamed protein product [Acanthoscelides obtectus]|uniref:Uncharacterized protein n=1 Tax=Acanthoscelides obtectus TaxID=200917 RepID=A0A9P0P4K4_ACAOB|nr:unnamed protein product [Acanthoscelides obtectus]CAK1672597.1 SCAN domain-containing protein 3 [Acanthoscelides obtectus]